MDPGRAPGGILVCHEIDGGADLTADPSPAKVENARAKAAVEAKPGPVPTYDSLWLDDEEHTTPSRPKCRKSHPEQPVEARQMWAWTLSFEYRKLLPQGKDLQTKIVAGVKECAQVGEGELHDLPVENLHLNRNVSCECFDC